MVLIIWVACAALALVLLGMIDNIVHQDLYHYGLRFSYDWANGYWLLLRSVYVCLIAPTLLSVAALVLSVRRGTEARSDVAPEVEDKPGGKAAPMKEGNMVISCPKCRRVFGRPLVMLDFSGGKTRLMNVCPYCNHVLGSAEEQEEIVDLDSIGVKQKQS